MSDLVCIDNKYAKALQYQIIWQKSQLDPTSQYDLTSMDIYHLPRPTGNIKLMVIFFTKHKYI